MNATLLPSATGPTLTGLDWLAIVFYFSILFCVAWWVVSRAKDTAADYFLAGRNLSWWVIGASIFASNIGSEHIVGLAGSGAKDGVAMAHYELHAWCLLVLAWVFVPFYARSLVFTMPEFLERRFSTSSRYVLSIVSLITFIVYLNPYAVSSWRARAEIPPRNPLFAKALPPPQTSNRNRSCRPQAGMALGT